jgi:hypothetical protein
MTRRTLKRHRGGGLPPWEHNAMVARRKQYRKISRDLRASTQRTTRAFRNLAAAADAAAASLRKLGRFRLIP